MTKLASPFSQSIFALLIFFALTALCSADVVQVSDAYIRAVPPGQPNTGAFMLLENSGDKAVSVTGATSPIAKVAELHTHINEDGMMKMRQIPMIDVPAMGKTELKPGGLHIMLMGLTQALEPGTNVTITLKLSNGQDINVVAPVKKMQMKMDHSKMNY